MNILSNSFSFTVVNEEEVLKLLFPINTSKSIGSDNIFAKLEKGWFQYHCYSFNIIYVIMFSFRQCVVTADFFFKIAKVVPLFMKVAINVEGNYRSVSILLLTSQVYDGIHICVIAMTFYVSCLFHDFLFTVFTLGL